MPAQLLSLDNGASITLDKPIVLVGRHPECDIQIDSRKISRRHCCIAQVADYLVIRDLGSTNGIRINGTRVSEGRLQPGDEVTIGNNRYQLTWDSIVGRVLPGAAAGKPAPPRKAARPAAPPPARDAQPPDDDMLEACDEPIPLIDDEADSSPLSRGLHPSTPPSALDATPKKPGDSRIPADSGNLPPRADGLPPGDAEQASSV